MEQNIVKSEPYDKKFLIGKSIYYNKETPFCLLTKKTFLNLNTMDVVLDAAVFNLETMDVISDATVLNLKKMDVIHAL